MTLVTALAAVIAALAVRWLFLRQAAGGAVDQHYWLVAASELRQRPRLPPVIRGRYLLEDERQAYPPFFGLFLSRFGESFLARFAAVVSQVADAGLVLLAVAVAAATGASGAGLSLGIAAIGLAPVLVAYNVQANPRSWGNLFLSVKLLAEVAATSSAGVAAVAWWVIAIAATAGVILSHKMSTQFMLALWPAWAAALGSWAVAVMPILGFIVAVVVTGPHFARLQWRSHADIIRFWQRHWRNLGAHAIGHSPLYGDPANRETSAFHRPGWNGAVRHLRTLVAYAPANLPLLLTPIWVDPPPAWLLVWFAGAYAVALLTLFVPFLRCLGGGHLYVFNAVLPGALWWMLALGEEPMVTALALIGLGATAASLALGWRQRSRQRPALDPGLAAALAALRALPRSRIAVFPLIAAETVAAATPHAVLWGGHGYGFRLLTPIFPVVSEPIAATLGQHRIDLLLWDTAYWPEATDVLARETTPPRVEEFGRWRLARLPAEGVGDVPSVLVVVRSLDVGGTERHLLAVLPKLAARGVPVELAVLHPGGALVDRMRAQGIVVYEANRRFGSASAFLWLVGLMRRRRPAIAHFFLPEAYLIGALAGLVADVPAMVMSRRSLNRYQLKRPTLARLERALHKRMALVSGNSDAVLAELGREGVTADRLRLIRNGIDLGPYDAMRPAAPVRAALGIATNALVLAMVANLIPYKGHADLIAALASRSADLPAGWRLLCIGRDTGIEADLRARAKVAGIDSNILWLGERSDVPDLLSASDIVVLASHEEGSPNAILEAMAARRPVIATDVGGNRELVTDGWNGILVPAADSVALGASLVSLAHDRFRMEAMGSAGRNLVGRNLGLDRCVEAYRALYDEAYLPGAAAARRAEDTLSPAGDSR